MYPVAKATGFLLNARTERNMKTYRIVDFPRIRSAVATTQPSLTR